MKLFDLEDGKTYRAFKKSGYELAQKFFKKDGKLYNDKGDEQKTDGKYRGCSYVPSAIEEYSFKEFIPEKPVEYIEDVNQNPDTSILSVKPGYVYQWENGPLSFDTLITKKGDSIYYCDKEGNLGAKISNEKIFMTHSFKERSKIKTKVNEDWINSLFTPQEISIDNMAIHTLSGEKYEQKTQTW